MLEEILYNFLKNLSNSHRIPQCFVLALIYELPTSHWKEIHSNGSFSLNREATMGKLSIAFYTIGLAHHLYVSKFTHLDLDFSDQTDDRILDLETYRYRYLTTWNLVRNHAKIRIGKNFLNIFFISYFRKIITGLHSDLFLTDMPNYLLIFGVNVGYF